MLLAGIQRIQPVLDAPVSRYGAGLSRPAWRYYFETINNAGHPPLDIPMPSAVGSFHETTDKI